MRARARVCVCVCVCVVTVLEGGMMVTTRSGLSSAQASMERLGLLHCWEAMTSLTSSFLGSAAVVVLV